MILIGDLGVNKKRKGYGLINNVFCVDKVSVGFCQLHANLDKQGKRKS